MSAPPFTLGGVLSRSLRLLGRRFVPVLFLSLFVHAPWLIWGLVSLSTGLAARHDPDYTTSFHARRDFILAFTYGPILFGFLLQAVLAPPIYRVLRDPRRRFLSSIGRLQRLPIVFLAGVILLLLYILAMLPVALLRFPAAGHTAEAPTQAITVVVTSVITLLILSFSYVVAPAAMVERGGPVRAIARSAALTRGHRWRLIPLLLLVFGLGVLGLILLVVLFSRALAYYDFTWAASLCMGAMLLVITSLQAITSAVAYHDLRLAKEGVGIEEIAQVFE